MNFNIGREGLQRSLKTLKDGRQTFIINRKLDENLLTHSEESDYINHSMFQRKLFLRQNLLSK